MSLARLRARFAATSFAERLRAAAAALEPGEHLRLRNTIGSSLALALLEAHAARSAPLVAVLPEYEQARFLQSDLEHLLGEAAEVLLVPPSGQVPYDRERVRDPLGQTQRADALQRLHDGFGGLIVTSADALAERVAPPDTRRAQTITLRVGEALAPETLMERLVAQGFEPVEFVELPGEVALRGGILDVYPFVGDHPVRVEFFGDEIDSLREFDPATQRSISRLSQARLVPNLEADVAREGGLVPLTDYVPPNALLALVDADRLAGLVEDRLRQAAEAFDALSDRAGVPPPEALFVGGEELAGRLAPFPRLLLGTFSPDVEPSLRLEARPQPSFHGDVAALRRHLAELRAQGTEVLLLCDSPSQRTRLHELLAEPDAEPDAHLLVESLQEGFVLPEARMAVYTDHQLFDRYHRPSARRRRRLHGGLSLRDVQALALGDYVVHVDHGIGRFAGLHTITVRGQRQEAVRLEFLGGDELFVSVGALHKLHRYTGREGHQPRLTKLGSGQWERAKSRTKKRVKDIARDLIALYARRKASPGFAFSPDTTWQRELEASFRYEDTPDQAAAAEAVKRDMEQPHPMDRLVCGDVGFGKTEIAVRAAFKAVQDGKQVAVLVPTSVLALQHFETFSERLAKYPVRIAQLSRFVSAAEQKATLERLARGEVDIVIGTQRLAGRSVRFRDLGLLVIDEEQRFGVAVKERLRQLRAEVDTLTLTATPIPRTLQFSLLGVRDLSIIATPPPNRQPVQTEIHTYDPDLVRDAILYEVGRGGQVFFVHNRVQTIDEMAATLRALVPDVRIRVAHGQMKSEELESVMHDFMLGRFDVLVSTNIVESGLDVGNANTMIIHHAERFGLADLHQLRGRVGRSDQKAFCYLLVPSVHALTREARMRLQAVEEFADLGSGFAIAMRDMDIRGAGALLGAEQSGFVEELGYETYHRILEEAVQELRHEEFPELFGTAPPAAPEPAIEVAADAYIPAAYVASNSERLDLYRRLAALERPEDLDAFRQELADRFGAPPTEVDALLTVAAMKPLAQRLRLPRVAFRNERLFLTLPDPREDAAFFDTLFEPLLERLGALGHRYVLKESASKRLQAIVQEVPDLLTARALLERLQPAEAVAA